MKGVHMKRRQLCSFFLFNLLTHGASTILNGAELKDSFPATSSFLEPELVERLFAREGREQVSLKNDDVKMTFGGVLKEEFALAKNATLLNKIIPDQSNYFRQTFDLTANVVYGEEKYDHKAAEVFVNLRSRALFGSSGKANPTTTETIKIEGVDDVTGRHAHLATQPLVWLREGWLSTSLNALFGDTDGPFQFLKIGLFPFELGRGISLGSGDTRKDYLGLYSGYENDIQASGILISGDVVPDMFKYDLYYAKLEEKSDSFSETMKVIKMNQPALRLNPFRGIWKDNDLFAVRFKYTPLEESKLGNLTLEPYVLYNIASDRTIEVEGDAKSKLGTAGFAFEYKSPCTCFELGAETAFNFGEEDVYQIDRNVIKLERSSSGDVFVQYSHIVTDQNNTRATVTDDIRQAVRGLNSVQNGYGFITDNGVQLYNSSAEFDPRHSRFRNRFRPAYTNFYRGVMFVTDAAYTIKPADLRVAATYGYASGDRDPHAVEQNKSYKGFIGLLESYSGKRVPSVFLLSARKLKRPLSLDVDTEAIPTDESFTDLHYVGSGLTWFPWKHKESKFFLQTNVLGYFKAHQSPSYDAATRQVLRDKKASRFLGVEWNIRSQVEGFKNLTFFMDFAVFFPGTYYKDVQGLPLRGDVVRELNLSNEDLLSRAPNYRLAHDIAFYLNTGMTYRF